MNNQRVLLDTSFFIRLLDESDPLHRNAIGYFKYFLEKEFELLISTIGVAEYCVRGNLDELPLRNLKILPFNLDHAQKTGELAKFIFENKGKLTLSNRNLIPNDTKLFAQAEKEPGVSIYLSSDGESKKIHSLLRSHGLVKFDFFDLNTPYDEAFGVLDL